MECSCSADHEECDRAEILPVAIHVHSVLLQSSAGLVRHSAVILCVSDAFVGFSLVTLCSILKKLSKSRVELSVKQLIEIK